jgi:hypothetical protein
MNTYTLRAGDLVMLNQKYYSPKTINEYGIARVLGFYINSPNYVLVEFVDKPFELRRGNEEVLRGMDSSRSLSKEEILSSTRLKYKLRIIDLVYVDSTKRMDGGLL